MNVKELNLIRKYSNQKIEKPTILLKVTNPNAYIKALEFENDCKENPKLKNKVIQRKYWDKKFINLSN